MIKCPNKCGNNATIDSFYGVIPCGDCQRKPIKKLETSIEFTSESIKRQRKDFKQDILQPYRKGELSKEYIEKWGTKRLKVTADEVKKAKYVWNGSDAGGYYNN